LDFMRERARLRVRFNSVPTLIPKRPSDFQRTPASPHLLPNFSEKGEPSFQVQQDHIPRKKKKGKMKIGSLLTMNSLGRTLPLLSFPATLRPILAARLYATQTGLGTSNASPQPRRKAVTAFNDDGRVAWGDLSAKEKAARTTRQTFNFSLILLGAVLTVRPKFEK